jgi:general secretion pathway protein D
MKATFLAILAILAAPLSGFAQFERDAGSSRPWEQFKLNPATRIKLDFRNASVDNVLSLFQKTSGVTIVKDPALTGTITVTSAAPVSLNEAFQILSTTLSLKNFELRKDGNLLVIRQRQQRGGGGGGGAGGFDPALLSQFSGGQTELRVYQLKYANASQVARVLNEVFAQTQSPFEQIMMMQQMQQQGQGGGNNRGGRGGFQGRGGMGTRSGGSVRASADDFSNSVIVNASSRDQGQVEDLIQELDKETEQPQKAKVYRLQYATADELAPVVQNVLVSNAPRGRGGIGTQQNVPFEQRIQQAFRLGGSQAAFGTVVADARTNSLVVTATDENQVLVAEVIKELDMDVPLEASTFVIPLNNARADQIANLLNQAFGTRSGGGAGTLGNRTQTQGNRNTQNRNRLGAGGGGTGGGGGLQGGGGGGTGGRAPADDPQALLLQLADPDADSGELATQVTVDQSEVLAQIFGQGGGGGQFRQFLQPGGTRTGQGQTARDADGRVVNVRDLAGQVTTIPDSNTNSIIVVASPENAELIRQILGQLDRIPEQVMIETIIVEATLDASTKLGVEWNYNRANTQPDQTGSIGADFGLRRATPPLTGLRYSLTGGSIEGLINALATDKKFQVLSTPRIYTSNNVQAQINISQSVPYVLSTREDPNGNLTFNYSFQDVGIVLTVTPRITANGFVTMDVDQTANDLQGFTSFNAPIVNQRQANTTVTVKDNETIILGGIIRNTVTSTVNKIPLLGDIPILGNLFKFSDKSNVKTELLVFLTPRIVRTPEEAQQLKDDSLRQMSPASRKQIENRVSPPAGTQRGETKPPKGG